MKKLYLCAALLSVLFSFSQSKPFEISGNIISEETNEPLDAATIYLQRVKDSTLITYTISDQKGKFVLEDKTYDNSANLYISYVGFQTYFKHIKFDNNTIDLKTIKLKESVNSLDEVVITSVAPITIKKDTLEFNVKSFKTKKDANVEDLLKKLPGVEVDQDGNIKVNGKPVSKILVNGKPFFGNDPTITTRNLTKDIIEKVQVVNTKTKSEAFTEEEGDDENKTINLTIKEENNKGVFGRVSGGLGTDKRYESAGMFNRFDNDQRISVLAGGNNINSPGFSFGEIRKMFGGGGSVNFNRNGSFSIGGRSFGGGQGIVTSKNAGFNYADDFRGKLELSGDYFYSSSSSEDNRSSQRENILPDRRFFTNTESYSLNENHNHSANTEFDIKLDSTLLITIKPLFRFSKNESIYSNETVSLDENNERINQSTSNSFVESTGKNFSNNLTLTKRFNPKSGYLKFTFNNEINQRDREDFLASEANIFGDNPSDVIRDQYTMGDDHTTTFLAKVNYNIPLIEKKLFFDIGYGYRRRKEEDKRSTFDKDSNNQFTLFNTDLSTDFEYVDEYKEPEVSLNYRSKKWSARFRSSYLFRNLESKDLLRPQFNLKRHFEAIKISSNFHYRFSPKSSTYIGYRLTNQPPLMNQLQAFQNVSNPLNIVVGNPDLEPVNMHRIYAGYNNYDFKNRTGLYTYFGANFENNQVVSKTVVNDDLTRETTYANVNGNYRLNGSIGYSRTIKIDSVKTLKPNLFAYGNSNRRINFNNGVQYASKSTSITPGVSLTLNWKDVLELRPRYNLTFTKSTFDIDRFEDREFAFHSLSLSTATFVPKHLEWRNEIKYNYNPNIADGFQKSSWFWNATLAYSFLKDKVSVTLKAYDILNQNTNARRVATENYIQDSQSTVLQQYFMLGFSWKFNSLGKKGEVRDYGIFHD